MCGCGNGLSYVLSDGDVVVSQSDVVDDHTNGIASLNAALCFRSLVTGALYPGQNAVEARWVDPARIQAGISAVRAKGNLHGKPALILHGRSDALIPPNHSSRAYYGLNKQVEGNSSQTSYIEVVSGNHFDHFIALFGDHLLVPMHYYLEEALTMMRNHLLNGDPLPQSQIVRASGSRKPWDPKGGTPKDLPAISFAPSSADRIGFTGIH